MTNELDNHQSHKTTLDTLMEGFQLISSDWRYLYMNDAVVKQSKFSRDQLIGKTMMEMYPSIDKTPMFKVLRKCMKNRTSAYMENEFTYPDNSIGWFELRVHPVPEGIFILSIDISERKKSEQHREKYMEDLEEMIFITCHKVRQPVANILGVSQLLEGFLAKSDDFMTIVGYMRQSAMSLDEFTRELTEFIHDLKERAETKQGLEKEQGS